MLPVEQVVTASHIYQVVSDLSTFYQALIVGRALDEVNREPIRVSLDVRADREGVLVKTTPGGFYSIAGRASLVFPDSTTSYSVKVDLSAPGYRPGSRTVVVPASPAFPITLPDALLAALPVRIQGRVMDDGTARTPLAGARVAIVDPSSPVVSERVVSLRTPLHFDHDTVGVTVRGRPFTGTGAARTLAASAIGGTKAVVLSDRSGLGGNPVLRFGQADDPAAEYAAVDVVSSIPANPALPGEVTLRSPLNHSFPAGTFVEPVALDAITTTAHLARPAQAGDGLLIVDTAIADPTVEINDVTAKQEYHALGAVADAAGFYRLDGLGRLRKLRMQATAAARPPKAVDWIIDYGQPVNSLDFMLST